MRRRHEIDVRRFFFVLKAEHDFREMFGCNPDAGRVLRTVESLRIGDFVVLAEYAAHIAAGEEDGTGADRPRNDRLFPFEKSCPCGVKIRGFTAVSDISCSAVYAAVPWAERAACKIEKIRIRHR